MISILTPTYNRGYIIQRLFESLTVQTNFDFEWVVVDDGSTDNTYELIKGFQEISSFGIKYLFKENGGKHTAVNDGVGICNGEWVLIVDSDDFLTSGAINIIEESVCRLDMEVVGLCFRKSCLAGHVIGRPLSDEVVQMTPTEAGHYYKGDLAYVFRKSAMIKCPFPVFEGERFVPELCIWAKISDLGSILFYSGVSFYRCEYLPDGYSANFKSNLRRNPKGFSYHYRDAIKRENSLRNKLKSFLRWMQCRFYMVKK